MTIKDLPLRIPRGEISPELLIEHYAHLLDHMTYPADVRPYIENFDEYQIQDLIVYGANMMPEGWPHDTAIDAAPNCEEIYHTLGRISHVLRSGICSWKGWKKITPIEDIVLDKAQFEAMKKGYRPDFDCRYSVYFYRNAFYMYRSGNILMKYRYHKQDDGLYHMTAQRPNPLFRPIPWNSPARLLYLYPASRSDYCYMEIEVRINYEAPSAIVKDVKIEGVICQSNGLNPMEEPEDL